MARIFITGSADGLGQLSANSLVAFTRFFEAYSRLDIADAWAIIGPINWYAPSSNLKLMFDRGVCMNGGNPDEKTIDHKNPEKAMELEHSDKWKELSLNHLEGRTAVFFVMVMKAETKWMNQEGLRFFNTKIILIRRKNHLETKEMLMHHLFGNAGMVV